MQVSNFTPYKKSKGSTTSSRQKLMAEANYAEFVIARSAEPLIFDKYKKLASKLYPLSSEKAFREFVLRDLICEISDNHQSYVYKKRFVPDPTSDDNVLLFQKDKQPYHTFPSCKQLHSASTVNRISYRIRNAVNLILESRQYKDDTNVYCKLYVASAKEASIPNEVLKSVRVKLLV
jgi:hypothetical protein